MNTISVILPYIQIALSALLAAAVLLQMSDATLGSAFGGDSFSSAHHTRRGFEKVLFNSTIILSVLFVAASVLALIYR